MVSDELFVEKFYNLIVSLGKGYFVEKNNKVRTNNDFESILDFKNFILTDYIKNYFIIGKKLWSG